MAAEGGSSSATLTIGDAVVVKNLTFKYGVKAPSLKDVSLSLPSGSRTLLVGDNGAGKSTLLKILSGSHLTPGNTITVLGKDSYCAWRLCLAARSLLCLHPTGAPRA